MMVQPAILSQYWAPILLLSVVVICGMIIFGTAGMLVTGQTLKVAIQSGFSLTQIGEFAFIIATLGMSLGVLDNTIYPIVVAVSVITTFTTPYFIKMSLPAYGLVERHLPRRLHFLIDRYQKEADRSDAAGRPWGRVIKRYLWRTVLYGIVLLAILIISVKYLTPYLAEYAGDWSRVLSLAVTLIAMSPFLLALLLPLSPVAGEEEGRTGRIPRLVMMIFRFALSLGFVVAVFVMIYSSRVGLAVVISLLVLLVVFFSKRLRQSMGRIESKFIDNLNERELRRSGKKNAVVHDLHLAYMTVGAGCPFVGERLMDSNIRQRYGVNVVGIQRATRYIPIPNGRTRIYPGDVISVIGTDDQIARMLPKVEAQLPEDVKSVDPSQIKLTNILLGEDSPLIGKTPLSTSLRDTYNVLVVAVDRGEEHIDSRPDLMFETGDIVWMVGRQSEINKLK